MPKNEKVCINFEYKILLELNFHIAIWKFTLQCALKVKSFPSEKLHQRYLDTIFNEIRQIKMVQHFYTSFTSLLDFLKGMKFYLTHCVVREASKLVTCLGLFTLKLRSRSKFSENLATNSNSNKTNFSAWWQNHNGYDRRS